MYIDNCHSIVLSYWMQLSIYMWVKNERNAQSSNYFLQTSFTARRNSSLLSEDLFKVIERLLYTVCSEQCKNSAIFSLSVTPIRIKAWIRSSVLSRPASLQYVLRDVANYWSALQKSGYKCRIMESNFS